MRLALLLAATVLTVPAVAQDAPAPAATASAEKDASLAALFEAYDKANLSYSPEGKAYRGIRDEDYGLWGDGSDASAMAAQQRLQVAAKTVRTLYDPAKLSPQDALSVRLFDRSGAAGDHPVAANCLESDYLKALWLRVE